MRTRCGKRLNTALVATLLLVLAAGPVCAFDPYVLYPYAGVDRYYGTGARAYTDLELARLRQEMREQRFLDSRDRRAHQREMERLQQQSFSAQQTSARQACYYRSTGGFELCADLFAADSAEFERCEALVIQRNPGCNREAADDLAADGGVRE